MSPQNKPLGGETETRTRGRRVFSFLPRGFVTRPWKASALGGDRRRVQQRCTTVGNCQRPRRRRFSQYHIHVKACAFPPQASSLVLPLCALRCGASRRASAGVPLAARRGSPTMTSRASLWSSRWSRFSPRGEENIDEEAPLPTPSESKCVLACGTECRRCSLAPRGYRPAGTRRCRLLRDSALFIVYTCLCFLRALEII